MDSETREMLARIEAKLDQVLAIWRKFEPIVAGLLRNPIIKMRTRG